MKVGDLVRLKEQYQCRDIHYGSGIILAIEEFPLEGFTSHKVQWNKDFSFHGEEELELISASR